MITTVILLAHVLLAIALIGLILMQHGNGADAGAAFGSGASSTVFGSQGSASFLSRATKWLAILFFITSGSLAYLSRDQQAPATSLMDAGPAVEEQAPTAEPAPAEEAGQDMPPVDAPAEQEEPAPVAEDRAAQEAQDESAKEDAPPAGDSAN
ncbi:MAG TPA: preprotein translocase subunit SecG [Gammaproteobacteria bacterium]